MFLERLVHLECRLPIIFTVIIVVIDKRKFDSLRVSLRSKILLVQTRPLFAHPPPEVEQNRHDKIGRIAIPFHVHNAKQFFAGTSIIWKKVGSLALTGRRQMLG